MLRCDICYTERKELDLEYYDGYLICSLDNTKSCLKARKEEE